jgi:hypothetical protein
MYQRALQGESNINHVFFYETMRNYIFPEVFTLVLDYSLSGGPSDWGWVSGWEERERLRDRGALC